MKYCIPFILLVNFIIVATNQELSYKNSVSQNGRYPEFCTLAAQNDDVFKNFRRAQVYREIVETLWPAAGRLFLDEIIKNYNHLLKFLPKICQEDVLGNPISHYYPEIGTIAPTTLRYIKIAGDLEREFGTLSNFNIAEIGGGYGGQCKIINDVFTFSSYTIIDLPNCTSLAKKFLDHFNINVHFQNNNKLTTHIEPDLIISNYAISEISKDEQDTYLNLVILPAKRGYIIYNHFDYIRPYKIDQFVSILEAHGKKVKIIHEDPSRTGDIIIWNS